MYQFKEKRMRSFLVVMEPRMVRFPSDPEFCMWHLLTDLLAASLVAGVIATYMTYSPWGDFPVTDQTDTEYKRVKAIREYIQSNKSSWESKLDKELEEAEVQKGMDKDRISIIWNGADKEAHKSAQVNGVE
jgi:hypothetical protein